ncbi:hypothetical protein [Halococcus agarilyticus]|uniref:hypothetical protein n=1 Tax=Halococcus agarilyticus TaxID=1232219 RepID=UPI000B213634|nr:hypothetical protein [Halococcus agarilyticus]
MQRVFAVTVVATLVVLAGCSAVFDGGGSDEPTPTITPMAVPTDEPTPTPVPQFAPGLTGRGIEDPGSLVRAHRSVLDDESFVMRTNTTRLAANGSVLSASTTVVRAAPPGRGFQYLARQNGSASSSQVPVIRFEGWSGGEDVLVRQTYANGTTSRSSQSNTAEQVRRNIQRGTAPYFLGSFGPANTTVERFQRNGSTWYRVAGTTRSELFGNVSLRMTVDSRGVIHEHRTTRQESPAENRSRTVTVTRLSAIDGTVVPDRPSWVDEATNRTTVTPDVTTTESNATAAPNTTTTPATNGTGTTDPPATESTQRPTTTVNRTAAEPRIIAPVPTMS